MDQYPWYYKKGSISSRFSKKPNLPPGIAHKLENNYYVQRDLVFNYHKRHIHCVLVRDIVYDSVVSLTTEKSSGSSRGTW